MLIWYSRRSIESDRQRTGREKHASNQLMPADRQMSALYTCPREIADNKLRGAGSESIERDRPDIYSDGPIADAKREEHAGQHPIATDREASETIRSHRQARRTGEPLAEGS